jgi:hypothetical protein
MSLWVQPALRNMTTDTDTTFIINEGRKSLVTGNAVSFSKSPE